MKKITLLIALLFVLSSSIYSQQFHHFDFEEWTDNYSPQNWSVALTINVSLMGFPIPLNLNFGERTTDCNSGNYALKLNPYHFPGILSIPEFSVPGIAQLGSTSPVTVDIEMLLALIENGFDLSNMEELIEQLTELQGLVSKGVPISGNPDKVKAFVKFLPANQTDTMSVIAVTTRWNELINESEIVGAGAYVNVDRIEEYTEIMMPVNNTVISPADTIILVFMAGGMSADPNTTLYVDDISVLAEETSIRESEINYLLYPNPVSNQIFIRPDDILTQYSASLLDINGRELLKINNLTGETNIDMAIYPKGVYLLDIQQGNRRVVHKVIVD